MEPEDVSQVLESLASIDKSLDDLSSYVETTIASHARAASALESIADALELLVKAQVK